MILVISIFLGIATRDHVCYPRLGRWWPLRNTAFLSLKVAAAMALKEFLRDRNAHRRRSGTDGMRPP